MKKVLFLTAIVSSLACTTSVRADEYESYEVVDAQDGSVSYTYDSDVDYRVPSSYAPRAKLPSSGTASSRQEALEQARFETEMMRQKAQQVTYQQQMAARANSQRIAENARQVQENQRNYENNMNMINNVNQAANTATNIARNAKTIGTLMNGGWNAYKNAYNW